jgi:hypothetical protein
MNLTHTDKNWKTGARIWKRLKLQTSNFANFFFLCRHGLEIGIYLKKIYVTDVTQKLGDLHKKLSAEAVYKIGPDHGLFQFFLRIS